MIRTIYSNFDHAFNEAAVAEAERNGCEYQHHAYNFCGYVRYDKNTGFWFEEVWVHRVKRETLSSNNLESLISMVNEKYGGS